MIHKLISYFIYKRWGMHGSHTNNNIPSFSQAIYPLHCIFDFIIEPGHIQIGAQGFLSIFVSRIPNSSSTKQQPQTPHSTSNATSCLPVYQYNNLQSSARQPLPFLLKTQCGRAFSWTELSTGARHDALPSLAVTWQKRADE